jgi:PAS domain S-box-containing protein
MSLKSRLKSRKVMEMKHAHPATKDSGGSSRAKSYDAIKNSIVYPFTHNDDFLQLLEGNARDIIFHAKYTPSFHYDYVSPSCTHITGYTPEEYYADPYLAKNCTVPEDYQLLKTSILNNSSIIKPLEIRWKRKDGKIIWTEHMISLTRDEKGKAESLYVIARDITERKEAEIALQESQQFNASLLEYAPHATVVINPDTSVRYVNPAWERINGWTLKEVEGMKSPYPWWPAEFKDVCIEGFKEAMKQGSGTSEFFAQKKNGEIYWITMNWVSVMNDGKLAYMIINSVDITDRRNMEEALKESENKYRSIFESTNDIIVLLDHEGKIIDANNKVKELGGFEKEEIIGKKFSQLTKIMPRESMTQATAIFGNRLAGASIPPYEIEMRKKNGEPMILEVNAVPLTINDKIAGDLAVLRDITNQKRSMLALKESEEKFSKAFSSNPNSFCLVTVKEGTFLEVNDSFLSFSGYSREEVIGHTPDELNFWISEEEKGKMARSLKETGRVDNQEIQSRMKSGEIRTGLFSAETIEIGGRKCMTLVITDITEQKKVEEALANEEVRRRILIEQSSDGIVILDQNGKLYEANQRFANMLGYTLEEVRQLYVFDWEFMTPREQVLEMLQTIDEKGDHFETKHRRKDGTTFDVEISTNGATFAGQKLIFCVCRDITERKQAQEVIRESEEKFSKAFQASPSSISISRMNDGRFIEVNDTFLRDKGYSREEIIGHTAIELNIFGNKDDYTNIRTVLKREGRFVNQEILYRTKSGQVRPGLMSAEIINIGNEECMIITHTDITQLKQAEEQLRLLSSVTQQVMDSIVITDPNYNITYINQAAEDMFGYTLDEVKGKKLSFYSKVKPSEKSSKDVNKNIQAGKVFSIVTTKKHKDGTQIICDCRLSPLYDENGKIWAVIDVQRDITKQKEVENKLQEHKKLIDNILANTPQGVLVIDSEQRILLANKAFYKIFHLNQRSLNDKLLNELFPADKFFHLHKAVKRHGNEKNTLEFRYQVNSQEKIIYCVAVQMDSGRTLLTFTDVSRERDEEEKLYLTDRLASIGEMAAGLAHELNNPLTGITTLSQLLANSDLPAECKEDIECIHSEAKRAASIVKNVLLFARNKIGENSQSLANEVIKDVLRLREYEERTNNISVVTNLEENLPPIPLDKGQLQQVLLNFISNAEAAIKETGRPGIIKVATQRLNNHVNITFSDNGCGIKKQIIRRIFDPFFTTKEIGKGTGLGLSICYSIIVKHGGKISVKSQANEGATFTIRMPIVN